MKKKKEKFFYAKYSLEKALIFSLMQKITYGKIIIIDRSGSYSFGNENLLNDLKVRITINHPIFYRKLLIGGSNGAAESYIAGEWEIDNLTNLIEMVIRNELLLEKIDNGLAKIKNYLLKFLAFFSTNTRKIAKKNIHAHYDLGNDFFRCFLDPLLMYSAAVYPNDSSQLDEAALYKLTIIGEKLQLTPSDHLLEIGTGWGGLAIFLAQKYGCRITTTTISDQQYQYVKEKIEQLNLNHQITLLKQDYRDLKGQYDKLVSIEMIEAIGHQYFGQFFKICNALLKPGGLMFLQAIVINDQTYQKARNEIDFIKKYIFPGGCLPSIYTLSKATANYTRLQLIHLCDISAHYVKTLSDWKINFENNLDNIKQLGFSNEFIRMWEYYFCYCMAGFNQKYIGDIQAVWRKQK